MTLVVNVTCSGAEGEKRIELGNGEKLDIGRSSDKASLTVDPRLSRKHFTIRYVDGKIEITHRSKTNPTMVAPLGSKDFKKIKGVQLESDGCRIMAGSHRFVLTVTKPDSEPRMGFSDDIEDESAENRSDFWSDVDSEQAEQPKKQLVRSETEFDPTFSATSDVRSQMTEETPSARKNPVSENVARNMPTQKNVFFDVESAEKKTEASVKKKPNPKPKKPPAKKPPKPIFPVGDDFFDD